MHSVCSEGKGGDKRDVRARPSSISLSVRCKDLLKNVLWILSLQLTHACLLLHNPNKGGPIKSPPGSVSSDPHASHVTLNIFSLWSP